MGRPRLVPDRAFPAYAYLPGRHPHPVRDPAGHSYQIQPVHVVARVGSEEFSWGADLFNHGYYWEAHEAWEGLWQVADKSSEIRSLLKGLILLSAAGVKIREGKRPAAGRHAGRAAVLFRCLGKVQQDDFERGLGLRLKMLADYAAVTAAAPRILLGTHGGQPEPVFEFILGREFTPTKPLGAGRSAQGI
ncbi:DUF309 domain-containing protein [Rhizobium sp. XQZ8]|uniref:DUF309 domain-containing protein n=1 Tax=Rhizobium populisoli TaxID=2859785 RepID=UPI001C66EF0F|nr:DUF309 domain-containing protein [Rhizobium populisoli]MBW6424896.1 DUF309 domain-containing protein [Rhizobium populisoli]